MWIEHDGTFYNLDKFTQISRGEFANTRSEQVKKAFEILMGIRH